MDSSQVLLTNIPFFCIQVTQKTGLLRLVVETPSDQTSDAKIESFKDLLGESVTNTSAVVSIQDVVWVIIVQIDMQSFNWLSDRNIYYF